MLTCRQWKACANRFNKPRLAATVSPANDSVEYALNAVNQGVTSLGIKGNVSTDPSVAYSTLISGEATNGIVLATEKKSSSPLIDPPSLSKVSLITPNIGMVYSGMGPDYRVLVDKARKVSHTGYKRIYNEYPPTRILVQDVARVMQEATQSGGVRPYGVSLLIAGWDDGVEPETPELADEGLETDAEKKKASGKTGGILKGGPSLYQVDPSGSCKHFSGLLVSNPHRILGCEALFSLPCSHDSTPISKGKC